MTSNELRESLLSSASNKNNNNNYHKIEPDQEEEEKEEEEKEEYQQTSSLNINQHSINNNTIHNEDESPLTSHHQYTDSRSPLIQHQSSEQQLIKKQSTAISMGDGTKPTNTNVISALRDKASSNKAKARVDNVFLYSSIPKLGDMFMDHQTSAITLLHIGFAVLTIILILIGYILEIEVVWKYGTFLCLVTNIFGITHSMYSGSISSKVGRLDAALQNFAIIIQKFAKALNIQEAYLGSVKNILDFLDHHILLMQYQHPEIDEIMKNKNKMDDDDNDENINYKQLLKIYYQFVNKLKHQTIIQHKKWLLTFFGQYKLLDNRFGITKVEYLDFIHKLPNKSRTFFQSLTGIHTRFKELDTSDELNQPPPPRKKYGIKPFRYKHEIKEDEEKKAAKKLKEEEKEEKDLEEKLYHDDKAPIKLDATYKYNKYNKYNNKLPIGMDINTYKSTSVIDEQLGDNTVLLYKDMTELVYKVLDDNTVLLYKDMTELVYKVLDDIGISNKRIENELAEKMISKERRQKEIEESKQKQQQKQQKQVIQPQGYILSERMSVSLARDAPQVKMSKKPKINKIQKTISISTFDDINDQTAYRKMKYDSDESDDDDDDVYNINNMDEQKNRSNTLPVTGLNGNKSKSISTFNSDIRKIKSYDSDIYTNVDFVKQRTLSMDDDWLKKVMNDLNDDESNYYDYSHSHKL